jgi:hypothetical protein
MVKKDDFASMVLDQVDPSRPFKPQAYYDPDGDCIEFLVSDDPFYAERIDALVTVYYSCETQQIIGSLIKGVRKFIKRLTAEVPGFGIEIKDGQIRLVHLFTARLWYQSTSSAHVLTYQKLRDVAERADARAELVLT